MYKPAPLIKIFENKLLSPPPSWLPALTQPADWFVVKVLGIFIVISLIAIVVDAILNYPLGRR
jgi:hypothetical protein